LDGLLAIGLLELLIGCAFFDAEEFIIVFFGHEWLSLEESVSRPGGSEAV